MLWSGERLRITQSKEFQFEEIQWWKTRSSTLYNEHQMVVWLTAAWTNLTLAQRPKEADLEVSPSMIQYGQCFKLSINAGYMSKFLDYHYTFMLCDIATYFFPTFHLVLWELLHFINLLQHLLHVVMRISSVSKSHWEKKYNKHAKYTVLFQMWGSSVN